MKAICKAPPAARRPSIDHGKCSDCGVCAARCEAGALRMVGRDVTVARVMEIVLRCPLIPEYNARRERLDGIAEMARRFPSIRAVELLPYHRLGRPKLERFGYTTQMPASIRAPGAGAVEGWVRYVARQGVRMVRQTSPSEAACRDFPSFCTSR